MHAICVSARCSDDQGCSQQLVGILLVLSGSHPSHGVLHQSSFRTFSLRVFSAMLAFAFVVRRVMPSLLFSTITPNVAFTRHGRPPFLGVAQTIPRKMHLHHCSNARPNRRTCSSLPARLVCVVVFSVTPSFHKTPSSRQQFFRKFVSS